jgi:hypothetical protein
MLNRPAVGRFQSLGPSFETALARLLRMRATNFFDSVIVGLALIPYDRERLQTKRPPFRTASSSQTQRAHSASAFRFAGVLVFAGVLACAALAAVFRFAGVPVFAGVLACAALAAVFRFAGVLVFAGVFACAAVTAAFRFARVVLFADVFAGAAPAAFFVVFAIVITPSYCAK